MAHSGGGGVHIKKAVAKQKSFFVYRSTISVFPKNGCVHKILHASLLHLYNTNTGLTGYFLCAPAKPGGGTEILPVFFPGDNPLQSVAPYNKICR